MGIFYKLVWLDRDFQCHYHHSIHFLMTHVYIRQTLTVGVKYRHMQMVDIHFAVHIYMYMYENYINHMI